VVVDKPMALNVVQTQEIIDVSKATGVPVTTYFNRRWDSEALTIKRVLAEGLLGEIFRLDSRFERFRPDGNPHSWREFMSFEEGGGKLLDLQPHLISIALDWFGPAELKYASVRSIRNMADDDSVLVLKHESGVDSYLSASEVIGANGPRIRLSGSKGSLLIHDLDPQEALLRSGKYPHGGTWAENTSTKAFLHQGDVITEIAAEPGNYAIFYSLVAHAIKGEGDWPVSPADALAVARIIDEAKRISIR
jgi:predicted dehydrogenase